MGGICRSMGLREQACERLRLMRRARRTTWTFPRMNGAAVRSRPSSDSLAAFPLASLYIK